MELKFEHQAYQLEAVEAVVRLFEGEPRHEAEGFLLGGGDTPVAANRRHLAAEEIGRNLNEIQQKHGLPKTDIGEHGLNFSVEMETGTGKTYVYLRTVFELNKCYGWQKFVVVVPSVAIREGVLHSIRATAAHFAVLYDKPVVNAAVYGGERLNVLRGFAVNNHIEILVMNIDSFNKDANIINTVNESGRAPVEFIRDACPIVIIDEPQNMETEKAKAAIASLHPLFVLRYSATHKTPYHKVYSLNPVAAYKQKLVKQIEVDSVLAQNDTNGAYLVLKEVLPGKKLTAKVELHYQDLKETKKKTVPVRSGDDLFDKSGGNESYRHGFIVNEIDAENNRIELSGGQWLEIGEDSGAVRDEVMKRQIEQTVRAHLDKEKRLNPLGIKVLSLFFIDRVANYRQNGKFAQWFEEIYCRLTKSESAEGVHNGYFSQDKNGWKDTKGNTSADDDTYHLIMRDKEKLLSFASPLRFIFSHSALKEGWDNPNVFQICTLNETQSPIKKRQEIGRGLRLAVNQNGERVHDESVNILTVVPNESYQSFAANLQKEYEADGIAFSDGGTKPREKRTTQTYRKGFTLDPAFLAVWQKLQQRTQYRVEYDTDDLVSAAALAVCKMLPVQQAQIVVEKAKIAQSLTYGVEAEAVKTAKYQLNAAWEMPDILLELQKKTRLTRQTLFRILQKSGRIGEIALNPQRFIDLAAEKIQFSLNNLMVNGIQYRALDQTGYEQSLLEWQKLEAHGRLFFRNGYTFDIARDDETKSRKSIVADHIDLDSDTEKQFARACENNENVKMYFKLPAWFTIPTPVGRYNPDWAVVMGKDETVYFVAETKNTGKGIQDGVNEDLLAVGEQQKIDCARRHFALPVFDNVEYRVVQRLEELAGFEKTAETA